MLVIVVTDCNTIPIRFSLAGGADVAQRAASLCSGPAPLCATTAQAADAAAALQKRRGSTGEMLGFAGENEEKVWISPGKHQELIGKDVAFTFKRL